jgi:hypothetical protein
VSQQESKPLTDGADHVYLYLGPSHARKNLAVLVSPLADASAADELQAAGMPALQQLAASD